LKTWGPIQLYLGMALIYMLVPQRVASRSSNGDFLSCYQCLLNTTVDKYVCRSDLDQSTSYCCQNSTNDIYSTACNKKVCSPMALTSSMKFHTCSFNRKKCLGLRDS